MVKIFEIFKDEGLPEKKLSNRERAELLREKIRVLTDKKFQIKKAIFRELVPLYKAGRVFTHHDPQFSDMTIPNVSTTVWVSWDESSDYFDNKVNANWLYMKDIPENQSILKWLRERTQMMTEIGFARGRKKGEGGKLAELTRRVNALDRAVDRRPKTYGRKRYT